MSVTVKDLAGIEAFDGLSEQELQWFLDHCEYQKLAVGEHLFETGQETVRMYVLLSGRIQVVLDYNGQLLPAAIHQRGNISGVLPYSNLKQAPGYGEALEESEVLHLHKEHFPGLEQASPALVQRLVDLMKERVRGQEKRNQQREKLEALGKLSAGLAHELNNPASAIKRMADELLEGLTHMPAKLGALVSAEVSPEAMDAVAALVVQLNERPKEQLGTLERGDREDELIDWMDDREVEDAYELGETLLTAGITPADLETLVGQVGEGPALSAVLHVLGAQLAASSMVVDIQEAARRISELVGSVKTYSHMDRANDRQKVNMNEGVSSTLVMLTHKMKKKNIQLKADFDPDLNPVMGFPGELNQVWTNILDNAIDALDREGSLKVRTYNSANYVKVDIEDNGPGIPPEVKPKIFDPFFTTKDVGAGSGMGLDIVSRIVKMHEGVIDVASEPGKTVFTICFAAAN